MDAGALSEHVAHNVTFRFPRDPQMNADQYIKMKLNMIRNKAVLAPPGRYVETTVFDQCATAFMGDDEVVQICVGNCDAVRAAMGARRKHEVNWLGKEAVVPPAEEPAGHPLRPAARARSVDSFPFKVIPFPGG